MLTRLAMAAACAVLASSALAQPLAGTGSIAGTVRDMKGAAGAGAGVEVSNPTRAIRRTTTTDSRGDFSIIALEPDSGYTVTVGKSGFATLEQQEIEVLVGEVTNLELALQLSPTQTKISVEATLPTVD